MNVIWKDHDREIPNHGIAKKGCQLSLPDNLAKSFVKQGLAEVVKPVTKKKEVR